MKKVALTTLILALPLSAPINAEFGVGLTASYSPNVYKGGDIEVTPFPLISYDNGHHFEPFRKIKVNNRYFIC
ncbi:hypothetical protein OQJ65_17080 [Vibrio sp. Sgm 22]|uniref:hypothetical protein n=1 Tax=unclassified Vibrio TaxID=2614977 RepID=UPI002249204B|nr:MULTISPECIES: hypothetical protein [unclassified Vibrio]MCX2760049.1 hypothetical protein [Vibrio sp. 14G-20]MCX2777037.1 hypothetical protein [Vibrio sp. Sgm 22]